MDTNYAAKEVVRDTKITNEMQQRAKVLSHKLQRDLRSAIDNQAKEKKQKKSEAGFLTNLKLHNLHTDVENQFCREAGISTGGVAIIPI